MPHFMGFAPDPGTITEDSDAVTELVEVRVQVLWHLSQWKLPSEASASASAFSPGGCLWEIMPPKAIWYACA